VNKLHIMKKKIWHIFCLLESKEQWYGIKKFEIVSYSIFARNEILQRNCGLHNIKRTF
jgi:hypothetical protein